jgi:hypothetical protein
MRSKIISGAFLALILVFSACKKDKNSIDPELLPQRMQPLLPKLMELISNPQMRVQWQAMIHTVFYFQQPMHRIIVYHSLAQPL